MRTTASRRRRVLNDLPISRLLVAFPYTRIVIKMPSVGKRDVNNLVGTDRGDCNNTTSTAPGQGPFKAGRQSGDGSTIPHPSRLDPASLA